MEVPAGRNNVIVANGKSSPSYAGGTSDEVAQKPINALSVCISLIVIFNIWIDILADERNF